MIKDKFDQTWLWTTRNWREVHVVFILFSLLFGTYFALVIPIGYTHDETVHSFRAYQLQTGQLFSHPVQQEKINGKIYTLQGGDVANAIIELEQLTGAGSRLEALCKMDRPCKQPSAQTQNDVIKASARIVDPSEKSPIHTWGASYYFFLPYLPAAVGMQIAELLHSSAANMIYAARLANVLVYSLIVGGAIYLARRESFKYVLFAIGLFPLSISLAAGLGVDMLLIAVALLLFSLALRALQDSERFPYKLRVLILAVAILIPVLKLPYIFLSLITLFLPIYGKGRRAWMLRILILAIILAPTFAWNVVTADMVRAQAALSSSTENTVSTAEQLHYISGHPFNFVSVILKSILSQNWLKYMGGVTQQGVAFPPLVYYFEILPILFTAYVAAHHSKVAGKLKTGLTLAGGALLALLAIFISLYISYTPVGGQLVLGVQGRYLIPALPFLFFGVALCFKNLKRIPAKWDSPLFLYGTYATLLTTCAIWYYCRVYVWV